MKTITIAVLGFFITQISALCQTAAPAPASYQPPTQGERFHHYLKGTFSVESLLRSAAGSGFLQATNTPSEWGQGAAGYARRVGNSYAQHIMRQTILFGASDLLHEDNRYIRSGEQTAGERVRYALESTFLARKTDGSRRLSYSRIVSVVAVAFLSREWQPHSTNGAQNAASNIGITIGSEAGFNVAREFLPKLFRTH